MAGGGGSTGGARSPRTQQSQPSPRSPQAGTEGERAEEGGGGGDGRECGAGGWTEGGGEEEELFVRRGGGGGDGTTVSKLLVLEANIDDMSPQVRKREREESGRGERSEPKRTHAEELYIVYTLCMYALCGDCALLSPLCSGFTHFNFSPICCHVVTQ